MMNHKIIDKETFYRNKKGWLLFAAAKTARLGWRLRWESDIFLQAGQIRTENDRMIVGSFTLFCAHNTI